MAEEDFTLERVDYALVHNVIYAGIEYAEEYEFKPNKDFTSVTQYFLEEDNDDIEMLDIECGGDDGRPVYVYSSVTTPTQEKDKIIAHLERTAGPGNFEIFDEEDSEDDIFDDDFEDDFDEDEDLYSHNTFEEKREIFTSLFKGLDNSDDPNDLIRLTQVTNSLFFELTDDDLVDKYYDELYESYAISVESEEIPNEVLGVNPEAEIDDDAKEIFITAFANIYKNLKQARKGLELLRKEAGGMPAVAFLELLILQKENSAKYSDSLENYSTAYPDYPLITLLWLIDSYATGNVPEAIKNKTFNLDTLFPGRESLHFLEMFYYLMYISNEIVYDGNADKIEAFYQVLDEFELSEEILKTVEETFDVSRIEYLARHFNLGIKERDHRATI